MEKLIQFCTDASLYDGAFDSTVGWAAAGMGYIIKTKNDSFIVVDGGHGKDADAIVSVLEKYSSRTKPCVALWIITHSHDDHYEALFEISKRADLLSRIEVQKIAYYFPDEYLDRGANHCNIEPNKDLMSIVKALGAERIEPRREDSLNIDEATITFLYVPDDCSVINRSSNANACSLIFRVSLFNGKSVIFTGDATPRSLQITAWRYGDSLKCDVLQMPHHALCDTGNFDFYRFTNAQTLMLPTSSAADRAMNGIYFDRNEKNRWAYKNTTTILKAYEGTQEINL